MIGPNDLQDDGPSPAEKARLMELVQRIFGADEQARDQAATDLVDLGPTGARALVKVMLDGEVNSHASGMWALLHTWADFTSLEIPPDLQDELVEAALHLLGTRPDNRGGVAWMAADVLSQHALEGRGRRVRPRIEEGLEHHLASPTRAVVMAGAYGLARLRTERAPEALAARLERTTDMELVRYLEETLAHLERDEDPVVFGQDA